MEQDKDLSSMNWIDRVIGFFSPSAGFNRMRARIAVDALRHYDGATKGRRGKNWRAPSTSAQAEVSMSLTTLRDRSRDLVRNEPYAFKGINSIVSNVVGTGIMCKVMDEALNDRFKLWCETKLCDYHGQMTFPSLQQLIMRTMVESGECLIIKRRSTNRLSPIQVQVLEPDFLDTMKNTDEKTGNVIVDGIELDKKGHIVAYHLFEHHPGNSFIAPNQKLSTKYASIRVPAGEVIHVFRVDRPGQIRGVPWLAPAMLKLKDYSDYEDAQLVRQKIASCFVGFITDSGDPLGVQPTSSDKPPMSERFEPGSWEVLPTGKDIKFGMPPGVGSDYEPYVRRNLLSVAAALGMSYEALTGDLSQVNFSSGRMGWIEYHRNIEMWRWMTLIPNALVPVYEWWLEGQALTDERILNESYQAIWTPPRREMIDPVKETKSMVEQIRSGLSTLSDSLRQLGYDPDAHLTELKGDFDKLDELGLSLDSDPRRDKVSSNLNAIEQEPT